MTQHCARCRRAAPDQLSGEFLEWESPDDTGDQVVCPGCITGVEERAIYEDGVLTALEADNERDK